MLDYSVHSEFVRKFDESVMRMIQNGVEGFDEQVFNELAVKEFEIQYHTIEYLRNFCQAQGITPDTVKKWEQIPALPSGIFKKSVIAGFPLYETELTLMTSGTSDPASPAKIYRDKSCVDMYFLANIVMTKSYLFPDIDKIKILLMVPSPKLAPAMGMAVGLDQMRQNFGTEDSMYLITPNGMEWELLFNSLHESEKSGQPVAIVGATSGLVYFFNFCREQGLSFKLPSGSRVCDGGGYLGTFGECSRTEYLEHCMEFLGIPREYCINTLGSGESTTNYFDNVLRNQYLGIKDVPRYKACPPWTRTIVVDAQTGRRLPKGEIGLLRHYDLVNRSNLLAVQTDNLGYEIEDGFEIIGRADAHGKAESTTLNRMISHLGTGSSVVEEQETRVCSTAVDVILEAANTPTCSTAADNMLKVKANNSLHGKMFKYVSAERLKKLKQFCPFLTMKGMQEK